MADINLKNIDDAWYRKVKILAAMEGVSVKELILTAISHYAAKKEKDHTHGNSKA